ncbi:MAG: DUF3108 domain-containing protein [Saprospiraceae bacterium]|nr:DUF3108 domain-containing protein [Saprospiraceae bacterium]
MPKFIWISLFLVWLGGKMTQRPAESATPADTARIDLCEVGNSVFQDGETIIYKLYYNWNFIWLAAGEVEFKVKEYPTYLKVSARGKTYPSYEWFFKVDDYFEAHLDKETLLPTLSIRDVHEGSYTRYDKVILDQKSHQVVYSWGPDKLDTKTSQKAVDGCMHDILSVIYTLRNVNVGSWQTNQQLPVNIFLDKESWQVAVTMVEKYEEKRVKGQGKAETHHLSPQLVSGSVFKEGDRMEIWVSADANHIPLLIESPVSVGSIKAVIKSWSNLKYPFELDKP